MDVRIVNGDQNNTPIISATVRNLAQARPLDVALTGPSGEQYATRASGANYGRVNVGASATQIIASNVNRLALIVQNVENKQMHLGWDSSLTPLNAGIILQPITNNSGDGGWVSITDYTGPVFGIMASGDADSRYSEFVK